MVSSAFSIKTFDTKAPAICKPPPLPPIVPPPPLNQTSFHLYATCTVKLGPTPLVIGGQVRLLPEGTPNVYTGLLLPDPAGRNIIAILTNRPLTGIYHLRVTWKPEGLYGHIYTWNTQSWKADRPFEGHYLSYAYEPFQILLKARVREVPA